MKKYILFSIIVFSALWFLGSATAQAATYWVSPTGSTSWSSCQSATDPGSSYCALNTANINAVAGDTVYLKGGTYTESRNYEGGIMPHNSGTGVGASRIIFAAAPGEIPIVTKASGVYMYGLRLGDPVIHRYIKVDGITFLNFNFMAYITNYSSYNEITNSVFTGGNGFQIRAFCPGGSSYICNPTHNWLHGNTFSRGGGSGAACDEGSDTFRLGEACCGSDADGETNYNTLEDNLFEYGGHATLDAFGRFTVFRNNVMHNEPWNTSTVGSCNFPNTTGFYTNSSYTGKYGHRNAQFADDWGRPALYNLIEGNRFGYASVNPNNGGADNLDLSGPKQIVRYNYLYGAMQLGLRFKYGSGVPGQPGNQGAGGWGGVYNRVFNNTIYSNGYGYPFYQTCSYNVCPGEGAGIVSEGTFGNEVKNNIIYGNHSYTLFGSDIMDRGGGYTPRVILTNNWTTDMAFPLFVNPDLTNTSSKTLPNLALQASSPAINGGTYLTTASGSGSNSTILVVQDALYFQDGTWGSSLARGITLFPDWIAIGSVGNVVQISSINYDTNTITLASPMTWSNGASIWLYKNSDGSIVLAGSAPDYGAYEYLGASPACTYTYSAWGTCQPNNTQSRTVISSSPFGCTGTPVLTQSCTYTPQTFSPGQYIQAESGALSGMLIGTSGSDTYVYTSTFNQGSASYTFSIQTAGQYRMEARVLAGAFDTAGANSWYVGLDSEIANGVDTYAYDTLEATTFTWDNVSLRGPSGTAVFAEYDPKIWNLSQGTHTFTFYGREPNAWLDQIILKRVTVDTTPPAAPSGVVIS